MKKVTYLLAAFMMSAITTGCDKDDNSAAEQPETPEATTSAGLYVLNQGAYYAQIEGSLNFLNYESQQMSNNLFVGANGRSLGATPQCGVEYDSKIYVGTYESNTIEVIDADTYKSIYQLRLGESNQPAQYPRSMVAYGDKIYICMYSGFVAELDTETYQITRTLPTGPNPDVMAEYQGKLYVPNTNGADYMNGYDHTATVIDLATFTVDRTIETPLNPTRFVTAGNQLFLLCMGNYGDVEATLVKINDDYSTTKICNATMIAAYGDKVAIINQPFTMGDPIEEYKLYDTTSATLTDWDIRRPDYANAMYYDQASGHFFIASYSMDGQYPGYTLPGYINMYSADGKFLAKYNVGTGPACMFSKTK